MSDDCLLVYLHDDLVGRLQPVRDGARFSYEPSYVAAHAGGVQLSCALPVREEPFDRETTRRWFSGLLPEDTRLNELRRFFGISSGSYLDLLREVGWECAGAVKVVPTGAVNSGESGSTIRLDEEELARRLAALPTHPYDSASTMRVSLGGYQEKLCVTALREVEVADGRVEHLEVGLPLSGAPTTHILKPQPQGRLLGLCEGEAWAMVAARHATDTAESALYRLRDGTPVLVIRRYDRKLEQGSVIRMHQEDCAQALGLGPEQKYAAERSARKSDPTFRGIAALLSAYALDPHAQMLTLLRQMTVNLVLGNTDAHAKNYSLVHDAKGGVSLSPLYDVVPAREITPHVLTLGMRVDGRIRADRIDREHVIGEATSWGLSARVVGRVLDEVLDDIDKGVTAASLLYPEAGGRHAAAAKRRIADLGSGLA
ncbi:type II toxin-antitoxin system HipA family toxin [Gordonibacter massiliensis (ex Traore et al. 2017)]|uniref:HipA domain-containing protein n=1 Tax=Gordonibacter massiliensis (ex Traore et al. 2017) TaxID=1841863 RepID=A0A842JF38_9ACTN|nr:HipA domain-containing protein [Gordonibacter massiliensis (ex Traore et al. 2017)]MBC2890054.1 HipA domain-containing protein [Gordonibacter massiliensis (ex Traore et al. 2017)]